MAHFLMAYNQYPDISELYSLYQKYSVITIDSRKTSSDSIFFALKGDNFNGNQFAESALNGGCCYAIIDEEKFCKGDKYILVKNVLSSLQDLAKYHRKQLNIPILCITGSNGKTTTKDLIQCVLSKKYNILATTGNLNNHIGVPLTLLSIKKNIQVAIIEIGANHIGEISSLCEMAQPDYGLITNIGKAHLGEFGGFENVIKAKSELYQYLKKNKKKIFLNSGNPLLISLSEGIDKINYDTISTCSLQEASPFLKIQFDDQIIFSQLIGTYNLENIASAICVGKYFCVENEKIKQAIEKYIPSNNRSQILKKGNNTIVLDIYNANPVSMRVAIENFSTMNGENKILILGDMLELGNYSANEHQEILKLIMNNNFERVILVGKNFMNAASEIKFSVREKFFFNTSDELVHDIQNIPSLQNKSSFILIKGSRGIKLEKVMEYL
ncbi:MAG: UDP-N-acetylmuramoyl-tripeptide--D-alanyl-D-alanine ligase [Bacteroidota bacterium]